MAKLRNLTHVKIPDRTAVFSWGGGDVDYAPKVARDRDFVAKGVALTKVQPRLVLYFSKGIKDMGRAFDLTMIDLGDNFTHVIDNYDWGIVGKGKKRVRGGRTWQKITDSGDLRESQKMKLG